MSYMTAKRAQIKTEALAATLLLIVLAALITLVILETGNSYKSLVNTSDSSQDVRTALNFITTEVHRSESGNIGVRKSPWKGNALVISSDTGDITYEDWIFYYKGSLLEVLIPSGDEIDPDACESVSSIDGFSVTEDNGLINVTVTKKITGRTTYSDTQSISLSPRA